LFRLYPYGGFYPKIAETAYIADFVAITGNVEIGEESSIWFHAVIRGDVEPTIIGSQTNIQDLCVLHQSKGYPIQIGDRVTVGHQVILHGCTIHSGALIGMGSTLLDGAEIGEGAFIGAGSLITQNKKIPPYTLAFGRPAKVIRELTEEEVKEMERINRSYVAKARYYRELSK
jgi:hypothetical protein